VPGFIINLVSAQIVDRAQHIVAAVAELWRRTRARRECPLGFRPGALLVAVCAVQLGSRQPVSYSTDSVGSAAVEARVGIEPTYKALRATT
jgi:hypothetical protein